MLDDMDREVLRNLGVTSDREETTAGDNDAVTRRYGRPYREIAGRDFHEPLFVRKNPSLSQIFSPPFD